MIPACVSAQFCYPAPLKPCNIGFKVSGDRGGQCILKQGQTADLPARLPCDLATGLQGFRGSSRRGCAGVEITITVSAILQPISLFQSLEQRGFRACLLPAVRQYQRLSSKRRAVLSMLNVKNSVIDHPSALWKSSFCPTRSKLGVWSVRSKVVYEFTGDRVTDIAIASLNDRSDLARKSTR